MTEVDDLLIHEQFSKLVRDLLRLYLRVALLTRGGNGVISGPEECHGLLFDVSILSVDLGGTSLELKVGL